MGRTCVVLDEDIVSDIVISQEYFWILNKNLREQSAGYFWFLVSKYATSLL